MKSEKRLKIAKILAVVISLAMILGALLPVILGA